MIEFDNYLSPGRKGHLIGIGGVSMSSLAEVLCGMGICVTGSDMSENANVQSLRCHGIEVIGGHRAENIAPDVEFVVRTAAVHDDNPEIVRAHELGIPVFERTQAWGAISKDYDNALCISAFQKRVHSQRLGIPFLRIYHVFLRWYGSVLHPCK